MAETTPNSLLSISLQFQQLNDLWKKYANLRGMSIKHDNVDARIVGDEVIVLERQLREHYGLDMALQEWNGGSDGKVLLTKIRGYFEKYLPITSFLQREVLQGVDMQSGDTLRGLDFQAKATELSAAGIAFAIAISGPGEVAKIVKGDTGILHGEIRKRLQFGTQYAATKRPEASGFMIHYGDNDYMLVDNFAMIWPDGLLLRKNLGFAVDEVFLPIFTVANLQVNIGEAKLINSSFNFLRGQSLRHMEQLQKTYNANLR